jgi:hypothetical protein
VLMVKIAERRATLLGLNPPTGAMVAIVQHEPVEAPTSTVVRLSSRQAVARAQRQRGRRDRRGRAAPGWLRAALGGPWCGFLACGRGPPC